ncbi:MAG: acyl transferase [Bacteroidota bacterium]
MLPDRSLLLERIYQVEDANFDELALQVFRYQASYNPLYAKYLTMLSVEPEKVSQIHQIPFLPIELFKCYQIVSDDWTEEMVFESSGTTGSQPSRHFIRDLEHYKKISEQAFEKHYGPVENHCILALLPAYLERQGSSLVYMVDHFIQLSNYAESGFFLYNTAALLERVAHCQKEGIPTLLIGVSFALLDLAEAHPTNLTGITVMETGGMKGRRKEITRTELHQQLQSAFGLSQIHSEYGMTELLSQAYSKGQGRFLPANSMRILTRELNDPFYLQAPNRRGGLNIIDLANLDSCSFIATEDQGIVYEDGSFEVLGRLDYSELRGCNLMLSQHLEMEE